MSNIDIDVNELVLLVQAVEIGIFKKVYTREELTKYFPAWNNLTGKLEKLKRQTAVEKLYREPEKVEKVEPKIEEVKVETIKVPNDSKMES
jgi:hypothetical protein